MKNPLLAMVSAGMLLFALQVRAEPSSERLVYTPYPGETKWKEITNKSGPNGWIRESIPAEHDVSNIKDIIVIQGFNTPKAPDPADFLKGMMKGFVGACENLRVNGPNKNEENGQAVAYSQVYCGKQKGKDYGVNSFIKVLQGKEAIYVVQREFHVRPTEVGGVMSFSAEQMDEMKAMMKATNQTMEYLSKGAFVCGASTTDVRCRESPNKK